MDGEEESAEERLRRLASRIIDLEKRIERESLARREALSELRLLRTIVLASASAAGSASGVSALLRSYAHGDIARHIVEALVRLGPLNISQLTSVVRGERGTASRRMVAEKLTRLEGSGVVEKVPGKRSEKLYRLVDQERSGQ